MLSPRDPPQNNPFYRFHVKVWKKIFHVHVNEKKKARVAILISDKIYFKTKVIVRNKEGRYIMIKGTIRKTLVHIC